MDYEKVIGECLPFDLRKSYSILSQRKSELNKLFVFDSVAIEILDRFVSILNREQLKVWETIRDLKKVLRNNPSCEGWYTDLEFEVCLALFSDKGVFSNEDESIGRIVCLMDEDTDNFNEFREGHPLQHQFHTLDTHTMITDSWLAWQDMLDVDNVWVDMKVTLQRCVDL